MSLSFDPQSLVPLQEQLEKIPTDELENYTIHKTKGGYELEKVTFATRIWRLFNPKEYDSQVNIPQIITLINQALEQKVSLSYEKLAKTLQQFCKTEDLENLVSHIQKTVESARKEESDRFSEVVEKIDEANDKIAKFPKAKGSDLFADAVEKSLRQLTLPKELNVLHGHPALQSRRDQLLNTIHGKLKTFATLSPSASRKIMNAIEQLDQQLGTASTTASYQILQSEHQEIQRKASELQKRVLKEANQLLKEPWQKAIRFNIEVLSPYRTFVSQEDYENFCDTKQVQALYEKMKNTLLPQLQQSIVKPVSVSVALKELDASSPLTLSFLPEQQKEKALVEKWSSYFPDFKAAVKTFGRVGFKDVELLGNALDPSVEEEFKTQFPQRTASTLEAIKTAFYCEKFLEKVKEAIPKATEEELKKAIAETLLVAAGEYNPVSRHSYILSSFSQLSCSTSDSYVMRPGGMQYQFSFSRKNGAIQGTARVSQTAILVDMNAPSSPLSTLEFTSEITKNFKNPNATWRGNLKSKELPLPLGSVPQK